MSIGSEYGKLAIWGFRLGESNDRQGYFVKRLLLILAVAGGLASVSSAAHADDVAGIGDVSIGSDYILVDGYPESPGPLSGYVYVSGSRVCADDNGSHGASDSATCLPS